MQFFPVFSNSTAYAGPCRPLRGRTYNYEILGVNYGNNYDFMGKMGGI